MSSLFIVPSFDLDGITIPDAAVQTRDALVLQCAQIAKVDNADDQAAAVALLRIVKSVVKSVDDARKYVKKPFLDAGRHVDKLASDHVASLGSEESRVLKLIADFQRKEDERVAEEERKRNAEIMRLAKEAEEKQKLAADGAAMPQDSASSEEDMVNANLRLNEADQAAEAAMRLDMTVRSDLPAVARATGMMISNPIQWEFTDKALAYKHHPEFFELVEKRRVIGDTIHENFTCPGMRIWKEKRLSVRV